MQRVWVQALVGELGPLMLHGMAKKKKFLFLMASSTFYHPCELDNIQSWEEIIVVTDRLSAEESWPRRVGMIPS